MKYQNRNVNVLKLMVVLLGVSFCLKAFSLTVEEQTVINHASEGAPSHITNNASFMMFEKHQFRLIKQGTNNLPV